MLIRPRPNPAATRRLVCLSFCGGGTAPFRGWDVGADTELVLVCYPGREGRFGEPFAESWEALACDVVAGLRGVEDLPYVLFGHSMGAWMAFDVSVRLARGRRRLPEAVVASANDAPSRWAAKAATPPTAESSDEELLAWMAGVGQLSPVVLAEPDLRKIAVDLLRADLRVSGSYRYAPGVRCPVPLHVLHGADDPDVTDEAAARWRLLGGVSVSRLEGGHFYTPRVWRGLPSVVDSVAMAPRAGLVGF